MDEWIAVSLLCYRSCIQSASHAYAYFVFGKWELWIGLPNELWKWIPPKNSRDELRYFEHLQLLFMSLISLFAPDWCLVDPLRLFYMHTNRNTSTEICIWICEFIVRCTSSQMSLSIKIKYKIRWDITAPSYIGLEALTGIRVLEAIRYLK